MSDARVVANHVDALKFGARVQLEPGFVNYAKERMQTAKVHGRASFRLGIIVGMMGFSRTHGTWHIQTEDYQLHVTEKATGAQVLPDGRILAGWTTEIVWSAQALAGLVGVEGIIERTKAVLRELGEIIEWRLRRIDLCADVAGWTFDVEDIARLKRKQRTKLAAHGADLLIQDKAIVENYLRSGNVKEACNIIERSARVDSHYGRKITGVTVCPGGFTLARIYDKRQELDDKIASGRKKKEAEETRWRAGGWDGEAPVTRVEFQLQGDTVRDLGLRNPECPIHVETGKRAGATLQDRIDSIWDYCVSWLQVVVLDDVRMTRCSIDPVWRKISEVTFVANNQESIKRVRVRKHASADQVLGCVLSIVGASDGLWRDDVMPWRVKYLGKSEIEDKFREHLEILFSKAVAAVEKDAIDKWGTVEAAYEHLLEAHDARRAYYGDKESTRERHKRHSLAEECLEGFADNFEFESQSIYA